MQNPVLRGFHPDPSILKHRGKYFIACSTFEYLPGIPIYSSENLSSWKLEGCALGKNNAPDLRGMRASSGVWAPQLSYYQGFFYLVYCVSTLARSRKFDLRKTQNYLIRSKKITGPWSKPYPLNTSGFDPSLFHYRGKSWLLNMLWDHKSRNPFAGISLQPIDLAKKVLNGKPVKIFDGTKLGSTEGPNLYRKDGYFWLVTAEGGTGWGHAVTVARSKKIEGPYDVMPGNPLLSASKKRTGLQKTGHASFAHLTGDNWVMSFLASRVMSKKKISILGRESCLTGIKWKKEEWPCLIRSGNPALPNKILESAHTSATQTHSLYAGSDHTHFISPRQLPGRYIRRGKGDVFKLYPGGKPGSLNFGLVALRQSELYFKCTIAFKPSKALFTGLAHYYDEYNFLCLAVKEGRNCLQWELTKSVRGKKLIKRYMSELNGYTEFVIRSNAGQTIFEQTPVRKKFETAFLSDEKVGHGAFTGATTGFFAYGKGSPCRIGKFDVIFSDKPIKRGTIDGRVY